MNNPFENVLLKVFGVIISITGYVLLCIVDWKLALGIFLIHWSINIFNMGQFRKKSEYLS